MTRRLPARKILCGYFGGSFDPIQKGHLALARAALREGHLVKVWFVPAGRPPHKPAGPTASGRERKKWIRLALGNNKKFAVADWDLHTRGPSYTYQTLRRLRRDPRREWLLILGEDSLRNFTTWRRWREILRHHVLLVGRRGGGARARPPRGYADRVIFLKTRLPAVSSTEVRRRRALGRSLGGTVPPAVARALARPRLNSPR